MTSIESGVSGLYLLPQVRAYHDYHQYVSKANLRVNHHQGGDDEWKRYVAPRFAPCLALRCGRLTVTGIRLDEMHAGINEYLGNRLSLANFGRPDRILELGYVMCYSTRKAAKLI